MGIPAIKIFLRRSFFTMPSFGMTTRHQNLSNALRITNASNCTMSFKIGLKINRRGGRRGPLPRTVPYINSRMIFHISGTFSNILAQVTSAFTTTSSVGSNSIGNSRFCRDSNLQRDACSISSVINNYLYHLLPSR